jgi:hypothetical protein
MNKRSRKLLKLASLPLAVSACCSFNAQADLTFNGFASIRATSLDSDSGASPFQTLKGDGDISFKDESLFALQARADLGDGLSATVQFMAEGTNDFDVEARWAYLSYQLNDTHRLSAGRFANPIFFQSQYEKVGYAHNFSRLPKAVYFGFDFATIEGIALDSSFLLGDYILETKVLYGSWSGETFITTTGTNESTGIKDEISINAVFSGDWWKIFVGGFLASTEGGTVDSVFTSIAQPGINAALATGATQSEVDAFLDALLTEGKDAQYWYAGLNFDYNNFIVDFEYADYGIQDSLDGPNTTWYASVGYRFDQYIVTLHTEEYSQDTDFGFISGITNPILNGTGKAIQIGGIRQQFDGSGITLRYDFHPSAALKVDYFAGNDERNNVGDYSIWSVGVDLVF